MKNRDILELEVLMPIGRKQISTRLKQLSMAKDFRKVKDQAEIIRDAIETRKPEKLTKLQESFRKLYFEIEASERKKVGEDAKLNYAEIEMQARSRFKDYHQMKELEKTFEDDQRAILKEECDVVLETIITESDLPQKDLKPETADMAVFFMK